MVLRVTQGGFCPFRTSEGVGGWRWGICRICTRIHELSVFFTLEFQQLRRENLENRFLGTVAVVTLMLTSFGVAPAHAHDLKFGEEYSERRQAEEDTQENNLYKRHMAELIVSLLKAELPEVSDSIDISYANRQTATRWPPNTEGVFEHYLQIRDAATQKFGVSAGRTGPWGSAVRLLNWVAGQMFLYQGEVNRPTHAPGETFPYETDDVEWMRTTRGIGPYLDMAT